MWQAPLCCKHMEECGRHITWHITRPSSRDADQALLTCVVPQV